MTVFIIALCAAAVLLLSAVPGYLIMKSGKVSKDCIADMSKVLLYVTQPALAVYTFSKCEFSWQFMKEIGLFALVCLVVNLIMLGVSYLVLRRKYDNPLYRIVTIATTFGNCAFFGIPILEALFPETSGGLIIYTTIYAIMMNIIGWTLGMGIINGSLKTITARKVFLNPAMMGLVFGLITLILDISFVFTVNGREFTLLLDTITLMGRMSTPLSMIIMGMRLATMRLKDVFCNPTAYLTVAVKQLVMPLLAFALLFLAPLGVEVKQTFLVISACPVASVVLNYAEIVGEGQKEGATMFLLGTILSVLTLPIAVLLLPLL